jgi:uncharacterized cupredoxin-like copper-binding protein
MMKIVFMKKYSLIFLLLVVAALASCSGTKTVKVTLTDYKIDSSVTKFKAGVPYHFVISNKSESNHEFMIMPPVDPDMDMSMEQMDEMALAMVEEDELEPGTSMTLDITFTDPAPAGTLEFACHVAQHYQTGMVLPISVE